MKKSCTRKTAERCLGDPSLDLGFMLLVLNMVEEWVSSLENVSWFEIQVLTSAISF